MSALTGDHHAPSPLTDPIAAGRARSGPVLPPLDGSRPFGVHIRMAWWKALLLVLALPAALGLSQLALYLLAGLIEGDPLGLGLTPLKLLAANLSTGITALLALFLVGRFAHVPWRNVFSAPRRFDWRRVALYLVGSLAIVGLGMAIVGFVSPASVGWTGVSITGTTIGLLVVVLLTTPLQAAGEEVILRGAVLPAAGSWFRSVKPAFISGLVVSSLMFAFLHAATDPGLFAYYIFFSVCTAVMGLITRGLEAAIAFHAANNLITTTLNALFAGGGAIAVERSAGSAGGLALLAPAAASVVALAMVWFRERIRTVADAAATPNRRHPLAP